MVTALLFVAGAIVTLDAGIRVARSALGGSLGRRLRAHRRLGKLGASVPLSYFESVLGAPIYRSGGDRGSETIWVDRYFYVQAHAHSDERVFMYSVTSRLKSFKPRVPFPGGGVYYARQNKPFGLRLGKHPFAEAYEGPVSAVGCLGARRWWYSEVHYLANPGNYQSMILSLNQAAPVVGGMDDLFTLMQDHDGWVDDAVRASPVFEAFRASCAPNTYSISGPMWHFDEEADGVTSGLFGADLDTVRVLPNG